MARLNRREVLADGEIQVVHCINRCVRRAFLCGTDPLTGTDYEHRRELIRQRMEFLASAMGVEVLAFSVMSNHLHIILRNRPDVVSEWSDDEVAQRWWKLCPARKEKNGTPKEPTELDLLAIKGDAKQLEEKRSRLGSISWFMRFLSEKVAREANKQDECTGRFWEGRFKAQVLLDEAALLACMQYVDLNPVRAGLATTPEKSEFTSAADRIADLKSADDVSSADAVDQRIEHGDRAGWIQPMALESKRKRVREKQTGRRPSNKGCLSIDVGDYIALLDWTGRQIRRKTRGSIPHGLAPIFERLQISSELWVDCVREFHKWFRGNVGRAESMEADAGRRDRGRAMSVRNSRRVFV